MAVYEKLDKLEISDKIKALETLVRNTVAYVVFENTTKANWLAHEMFADVLENEDIIEIFDED